MKHMNALHIIIHNQTQVSNINDSNSKYITIILQFPICLYHIYIYITVVILGDDNDSNDADVRDLIFTTQSLVKRNKKIKGDEKVKDKLSFHKNHKITTNQDAVSITYPAHNIKSESSLKEEGDIYEQGEWVLETQLHKRKLKKDIDYTPHL